MTYDVISLACEQLSYRDKFRLAQLLIQTARKEEEEQNPQNRAELKVITQEPKDKKSSLEGVDTIEYVVERLLKLKPTKQKSLTNSIKSMFQFQGGIANSDINKIVLELQKRRYIKIEQNTVNYL